MVFQFVKVKVIIRQFIRYFDVKSCHTLSLGLVRVYLDSLGAGFGLAGFRLSLLLVLEWIEVE